MIKFNDNIQFTPCYTPIEMFEMGIFGGAYFKIKTNLPNQFIEDAKDLLIAENRENKNSNRYNIISGSSLEWWLEQNLIHRDDPKWMG